MNRYLIQLGLLFLLMPPLILEAYPIKEVRGMVISGNADTITYSLQSLRPSPPISSKLNPKIDGTKMTLDYGFTYMACSIGEDAVVVRGDSIIIQKTLIGGCRKHSRIYFIHAEIAGIPRRDFMLVIQLLNAYVNPCGPSINTLASLKMSLGSSNDSLLNTATGGSGRLAFQPIQAKETFKSGYLKVGKSSAARYEVQKFEDSLPVAFTRDTLGLHLDNGEVDFESRYGKQQCGEYGIGIRASADTIYFVHKDGGECSSPVVSHGLKGRISGLSKGRYFLKIRNEKGFHGICANDAKTLLTREIMVP